jgi:hypothetical protein
MKFENNEKFDLAEYKERVLAERLFQQQNINQYVFTETRNGAQHDGWYTATTSTNKVREVVFEIKNRNIKSNKYKTTFIEADKVKHLQREANKTGHIPYGFVFWTDNKYMSFKINKDYDYPTVKRWCPEKTMGNTTMVEKDCVDFKINITNDFNTFVEVPKDINLYVKPKQTSTIKDDNYFFEMEASKARLIEIEYWTNKGYN